MDVGRDRRALLSHRDDAASLDLLYFGWLRLVQTFDYADRQPHPRVISVPFRAMMTFTTN